MAVTTILPKRGRQGGYIKACKDKARQGGAHLSGSSAPPEERDQEGTEEGITQEQTFRRKPGRKPKPHVAQHSVTGP